MKMTLQNIVTSWGTDNLQALGAILSGLGTLASVVVAVFALSVAVFALYVTRRAQRVNETGSIAETLEWCHTRYFQLEKEKDLLNSNSSLKIKPQDARCAAKHYFERLWELHYVEYYLYRRSLIPLEMYGLWIWIRINNFNDMHENHTNVGPMTQKEGWDHAQIYLADSEFRDFMTEYLSQSMSLNSVREKLRKEKVSRAKNWLRRKVCEDKCR